MKLKKGMLKLASKGFFFGKTDPEGIPGHVLVIAGSGSFGFALHSSFRSCLSTPILMPLPSAKRSKLKGASLWKR